VWVSLSCAALFSRLKADLNFSSQMEPIVARGRDAKMRGSQIEHERRSTEKPKRYPKGRCCPDCGKLLSTWNAGPRCYGCSDEAIEPTLLQELVRESDAASLS
jgi:hypothetical protein